MQSSWRLVLALLVLFPAQALASGHILTNGRITLDFADPAVGNATDSDRIDSLSWINSSGVSTGNLVATGASVSCGDPHEFFGQSYSDAEGQSPYLVIAGTVSSWSGNSLFGLTATNPSASTCLVAPYTNSVGHLDGVASTIYSLGTQPALINTLHVTRTIVFSAGAASHDIRGYVARLPNATYSTVIIPNTNGIPQNYSVFSCPSACEIANWNATWFADDNGSGTGLLVIRDPGSTWPAVVAIDYDDGSASNLTSIALKVPSTGWSGSVSESEYLCLYDSTSWPAASRSSGQLPAGCQVTGAYNTAAIHTFAGSPTAASADGAYPSAQLIADKGGVLYGTTLAGGANLCKANLTLTQTCGTLFTLAPPVAPGGAWTESVVYDFNQKYGWAPQDRLRLENGVVYGTTLYGGHGCSPIGCGTVYAVTLPAAGRPAIEKVLHGFDASGDGLSPNPRVLAGSGGVQYGSTRQGGIANAGVIYKLTPPASSGGAWGYAVLYRFTGAADGGTPNDITIDSSGAIYGTTQAGGTHHAGVAYKLSPPATTGAAWTLNVLHNFAGGADGAKPQGGVIMDAAGALYSTTTEGGSKTACGGKGCGTVFKLSPAGASWTESVLYAFQGQPDGSAPTATLIGAGTGPVLYGTTGNGGPGAGTAFQLTPPAGGSGPWTETVLYGFTGAPDGAKPNAGLYRDATGALYGTTLSGGTNGMGTVYQITP